MIWKAAITLLAAGALAPAAVVSAQDAPEPLHERTALTDLPLEGARAAMQLEHVTLSISVNPQSRQIAGDASYRVLAEDTLDELVFDLDPRFAVRGVSVAGEQLDDGRWTSAEGLLTIHLAEPLLSGAPIDVRITYDGAPHVARNAPWEGGFVWSETPEGKPWIATAVQGEGCDLIWPCIDHSSKQIGTLDLIVSVPKGLVAAGNGRLIGTRDDGDRTVFHWQARDPSNYGIALQIAPYEVARRDYDSRFGNAIPMMFFYLPGKEEGANRLLGEMSDQIAFMEDRFGPYPFADEKVGVAETPLLGMEHQTILAYGNGYPREAYGHDQLLQHELAHEWFANQLRHATINHMWMPEGITTWTQPLYLEHVRGTMFYDAEMWRLRQRVWSRVPLVPPEGDLPDYNDREAKWGDDIYFKGAWIMHTLRYLVGEQALFPALTRLTYGNSNPVPGETKPISRTTHDFRLILEDITAQDLRWFFDAYFYQADLPRLAVKRDGRTLTMDWITPSPFPFAMPVEVRIDGRNRTLMMEGGHGELTLPAADTHFLIDPGNRILKHDAAIEAWQNRDSRD
ncbi:M1 family metallopeptidase [Aurantiacibacter rhizosphaerae]|uniref:M1 family peptidase n=1 Tax=Aurantiacibacter rhizosphaerae TaxID=2691582 RepID=A0A844X9I1_9SPHN|nr:M1 family metallopeptidase [Aurantiacibacter rhizosphaerae]MWV26308.1 M1 family peptidase [Aurantiacibacter rhizosphaerae]